MHNNWAYEIVISYVKNIIIVFKKYFGYILNMKCSQKFEPRKLKRADFVHTG